MYFLGYLKFIPIFIFKQKFMVFHLYGQVRNFKYYPPVQNQPKYHILFHKDGSPHYLCIMTLSEPDSRILTQKYA